MRPLRLLIHIAIAIVLTAISAHPLSSQFMPEPGGSAAAGQSGQHNDQSLTGRLEDNTGAPLSGVLTELHTWSGELISTTVTGMDGEFRFDGVALGQYTLKGNWGSETFNETINFSGGLAPLEVRINEHPVVVTKPAVPKDAASSPDSVSINDLEASPEARNKLSKATQALHESKLDKALHLVDEVLKIDPKWSRAWLFRGMVHQRSRDFTAAHQDFQSAAQADPGNGEALAALGGSYTHAEDWKQAEFYLQRATTVAPNTWQAWFELARLQLLQGKYTEAASSARKSLETHPPGPAGCRYFLGEAEAALGHLPEAAQQFRLFLASDPPPSTAVTEAAQKLRMIEGSTSPAAQPAGKPQK